MSPKEKLIKNHNSAVIEFADLRRFAQRVERLLQHAEQERQIELQHLPEEQVTIAELFADPFPQVFYSSVVIADCILLEQHIEGIADTLKHAAGLRLDFADLCCFGNSA